MFSPKGACYPRLVSAAPVPGTTRLPVRRLVGGASGWTSAWKSCRGFGRRTWSPPMGSSSVWTRHRSRRDRCNNRCRCGWAARRARPSSRTARWGTGWQAGIESADKVGPVIRAIKHKTREFGRRIDEDHFGAGFAFRFGSPDEPIMQRYIAGFAHSLGQTPGCVHGGGRSRRDRGAAEWVPDCGRSQIRSASHRLGNRRCDRSNAPPHR